MKIRIILMIIIFVFTVLDNINLFAQKSYGGKPSSFSLSNNIVKSLHPVKIIAYNKIKNNECIKEDSLSILRGDIKSRYAVPVKADIDLKKSATTDTLLNGDILYRLRVKSENAYAVQLMFDDFFLNEDAELYVYNFDSTQILGVYNSLSNKVDGKFIIEPVNGDIVNIELYESKHLQNSRIHISNLAHAYRNNSLPTSVNKSLIPASCERNVNCPEGDGWNNQKRSVVQLSKPDEFGYIKSSSGAMINNTNNDGRLFLLTAYHVLDGEDDSNVDGFINDDDYDCNLSITEQNLVNQIMVRFNYQYNDCNGTTLYQGQTLYGCSLLVADYKTDFALLEVTEKPDQSYNIYLAGWDNSWITPTSVTCIHHPLLPKQISISNTAPTILGHPNSNNCYVTGDDDTYFFAFWDAGKTDFGSSGAPLFNQSGYICGQLSGGPASSCVIPSTLFDAFGRFALSWFNNTSLVIYLDPQNSSPTTLEGIDWNITPAGHCNNQVMDADEEGIDCGGSCFNTCTLADHPFAYLYPNNANPNCDFCEEHKVFEGKEWDDKSRTYYAYLSVTAKKDNNDNPTVIKNNSDIRFYAYEYISLEEVFEVQEGSTFEAIATGAFYCGCPWFCEPFCYSMKTDYFETSSQSTSGLFYIDYNAPKDSIVKSEIFDISGKNIAIQPNPNNGVFTLTVCDFQYVNSMSLSISDIFGKIIYRRMLYNKKEVFNVNFLFPGLYFVKVVTGDEVFVQKLIISK